MPYIEVAAWTQNTDSRSPILRAISGPERSEFVPLPQSEAEVETIAHDLPRPNTILLGANATETRFKELSTESTEVIHLALHGYADVDYPDRSALIFAPEVNGPDDGLLQAREIRELHIKAKLVTLSACDTGVGPVGEADVANVVNAFIEAGADSTRAFRYEPLTVNPIGFSRMFFQEELPRERVSKLATFFCRSAASLSIHPCLMAQPRVLKCTKTSKLLFCAVILPGN